MSKASRALAVTILLFLTVSAWGQDFASQRPANWHQWRGPEANGLAPQGDPPTEWSETKNVKWKVPIPGAGNSSPIVWGDRIFLLTAVPAESAAAASASATRPAAEAAVFAQRGGDGGRGQAGRGQAGRGGPGGRGGRGGPALVNHKFVVLCLDRRTGRTIWEKTAREETPHEGHHPSSHFATSSPITDGKLLYASFGSRGLYCYDLDGNEKWSKDLGDMQIKLSFGEGASPALYGNTLVVNWDHEGESFIVALNATTGDELWRTPREEATTWATPLIVPYQGKVQVITNGQNRVRSYDLANGRLIWECGGQGPNPIPSPVVLDDTVIVMTGFQRFAVYAIPLDATGDITETDKPRWKLTDGTPYVSSPLLYDETLYFTKDRNNLLTAVDARTGRILFDKQRLPEANTFYASPVGAAGRVFFSSREGTTVVLKHGPTFEVVATNKLDGPIDASPAIVGREMFIRAGTNLYCIAETAAGGP